MQRQPVIDMILSDQPMPTPRERQTSWLVFNFALMADVPIENVSVVYADDAEAITVHLACTCADRHVMTFTMWIGSDDDQYIFEGPNDLVVRLPFEPHMGETL